jgi:hypothetical protein
MFPELTAAQSEMVAGALRPLARLN